jgi:hypothetical protein
MVNDRFVFVSSGEYSMKVVSKVGFQTIALVSSVVALPGPAKRRLGRQG